MKALSVFVVLMLVIGCAASGDRLSTDAVSAVYQRHAGAHEQPVRYSSIRSWHSAGYHGVVLELDGRRHYLLEVTGPCSFELPSAMTLRLETAQPRRLSRFDSVAVDSRVCQVQAVRRVDMEAVEEELAARREQVVEPREDVVVESADQDEDSSGGV
ncbi:MAG: hypothetical protein HND55_10890 [Pseudomonadota bacterium]|nr:MAG: hypothetical protein HND55_10890 [Pseudomonadota bacterium]